MNRFPFRADWVDLRFIHYRVDPAALQPFVPHPLDLHEGSAWVSLVAFAQRRFRPAFTGAAGALLFGPVASHDFLNVRTYVRCRDEPGIFFLAEWVPRRMAAFFGPRTWGLPYRLGKLQYEHDPETGTSDCKVTGEGVLQFRCQERSDETPALARPGSVEEFLFERYTAFTQRGRQPYAFRIAHAPWQFRAVKLEVIQDDLMTRSFPWYQEATQCDAHYSAAMANVALSTPSSLEQSLRGVCDEAIGWKKGYGS